MGSGALLERADPVGFGTAGTTTGPGPTHQWTAIDLQGAAVVATGQRCIAPAEVDFYVARYTTAGAIDTSFGTTGELAIDFGGADHSLAVAVGDDGRIYIVGSASADFGIASFGG